jgi:hypothetical protein
LAGRRGQGKPALTGWLRTIRKDYRLRRSGERGISLSTSCPRRPYLDPLEIRRIVAIPERRFVQPDGRFRLYGYSEPLGCYLRVVLLSDGETVHNAFADEEFAP